MSDDAIQLFRGMLSGDANNVSAGLGGGGGGQHIGATPLGGGGMDAWQTSVENRLGALDTRLGGIETRLGGVETKLATLDERVAHLPGKGFIVTTVVGGAALLGAIGHYLPKLLG